MFLLLSVCIFSCKSRCDDNTVKQIMGHWYKKQLLFPEKMNLINKDSTKSGQSDTIRTDDAPFYVVHFFTADCDECINVLLTAQKFIQQHKDIRNVRFIFIASGPSDYYASQAIHKSGFTYPVFYEKEYFSFKKINDLPLSDKMYNTILINQKREILLFGGIFNNEKAAKLFFDIINCQS
jgi:hypothetical protein